MINALARIAARNVFRNKRRSAIALTALFFGVFMIIVLNGLTDGFSTMATLAAVETRTAALQVHKKGLFENLAGNPADFAFDPDPAKIAALQNLAEVRAVSARLKFVGQITNGVTQTLILGTGYEFEKEKQVCLRAGTVTVTGSQAITAGEGDAISIGQTLAESLGLDAASDPFFQGTTRTPKTMILSAVSPQGKHNSLDFGVKAIFKGMNAYEEKRQIGITLGAAQQLLNLPNKVTEIAIALHNIKDLESVQQKAAAIYGPGYEVHTWKELQPFLRDVLFRQQVGISILSVALMIMVLFLIANTMLMAVFERTREMGTMVALGIKRKQIVIIFLLESTILGSCAATIGCVCGTAVVLLLGINGFEFGTLAFETQRLYPEVSLARVIQIWFAAIFCAAAAGTYPAYRASLLNPVEALRST